MSVTVLLHENADQLTMEVASGMSEFVSESVTFSWNLSPMFPEIRGPGKAALARTVLRRDEHRWSSWSAANDLRARETVRSQINVGDGEVLGHCSGVDLGPKRREKGDERLGDTHVDDGEETGE